MQDKIILVRIKYVYISVWIGINIEGGCNT